MSTARVVPDGERDQRVELKPKAHPGDVIGGTMLDAGVCPKTVIEVLGEDWHKGWFLV